MSISSRSACYNIMGGILVDTESVSGFVGSGPLLVGEFLESGPKVVLSSNDVSVVTFWASVDWFTGSNGLLEVFVVPAGLEEKDDDHPIPSHAHAWAASALAGGISGAFTWAIIYPFDVIKSQIQTGPLDKRISMWKVGYDIVKEHGWRYMFRGLGVTLCRAFPVNAIIFPVYEFVLIQLGDSEEDALEDAYNTSPNPSK